MADTDPVVEPPTVDDEEIEEDIPAPVSHN